MISTYSPLLEIASIDECYVDFSNYIIEHNIHPYKLAKIIQNDVLNTLKLKCSIGIAPNKFMAKMASDMKKPMGITILNKSNYKQLLWPLDVSEMFGIGKKTAQKLILELKDKLKLEDAFEKKLAHEQEAASVSGFLIHDGRQEAAEALIALGYSSTDAMKAVRKVTDVSPDDVEALLKAALKQL